MEKRFRSLRFIGTVLKILAWITLVLGVLGGIVMFIGGIAGGLAGSQLALPSGSSADPTAMLGLLTSGIAGVMAGILSVFFSFLYFLFLYAAGDAIYLALAIEENTRETAWYLKGGDGLRR